MLARLLPSEVVGVLNLASARPGTRLFHLLTDEVRVPYGVQVAQVTPATISLSFERSGSRIVPVVPAVEGDPAAGYVAGRITSEPAVVEVVGPVSLLGDLKNATTEPVSIDQGRRGRSAIRSRSASPTTTCGCARRSPPSSPWK